MLQKLSVVAVLIFISVGALAADEHQETGEKKSTSRPTAVKKKPSIAEKISACLTERPTKKEDAAAKPSSSTDSSSSPHAITPSVNSKPTDSTQDGAALFTKHCASCHSAGDMDWATAKQVVGVTMPFGKVNTVTPEEVAKLKEYFQTQIK